MAEYAQKENAVALGELLNIERVSFTEEIVA